MISGVVATPQQVYLLVLYYPICTLDTPTLKRTLQDAEIWHSIFKMRRWIDKRSDCCPVGILGFDKSFVFLVKLLAIGEIASKQPEQIFTG